MRIREANNLARVTGVGENFLVSGKAGVKNDFAAAARDRAGRAAVKYAPVFEREYGGSVQNFGQRILRRTSFVVGLGRRQRAEMIHGPIGENSASVDVLAGDGTENARIVGADTVIAHDEIIAPSNFDRAKIAHVGVLGRHVRLGNRVTVDIHDAPANLYSLTGQTNDALDKRFRAIQGIPEHNDIAANNGLEPVHELVNEDALLIGKKRRHARAFDFDGLIQENNDDKRQTDGDK
jgi:hypothetical protein